MTLSGRRLGYLLVAAILGCTAGCFGGTQGPSYFPYWLPTGDVIRTHPKPIGPGYLANFDPHAVDLALEPTTMTSQVGSQVVVLATVRDEKTNPRRGRRVEWKVVGGNIVEVDERGYLPGRGDVNGNTAFSFTGHGEDRISRGNKIPADDIMVRPGQTWITVTSPVEGDTHITAIVPGIHNWDKRLKTTIVRWVDAVWEFPPRGVAKFGTEHEFVTKIARFSDRQPLAKYRVRYKIIDGPDAILLPSRTREEVVVSDLNGNAKVRIAQVGAASGTNRVSVEIIRPPDPTTPTGSGVSIVTGETAVDWLAPSVKLNHIGPAAVALEQNAVFTTTAKNEGRLEAQWVEIKLPIPDGMEFVGSNPPAEPRNNVLEYPFTALAPGQAHTVQATFRAKRAGPVRSIALMRTSEGQNDQQEFITQVTTPQLKAEILAPQTGVVDAPITYTIRLTNPGSGDLDEINIKAEFDPGLESDLVKNPANDPAKNFVTTKVAGLKPGESRNEVLVLTPKRAGALNMRVTATSSGLVSAVVHTVTVQRPNMTLRVQGPDKRYVGRSADYTIIVKNEGAADQTGVVVRDRLPAELRFTAATRGGNHAGGEVTWNLGVLKAGEEAVLELKADCLKAAPAAEKVTLLTADGNVSVEKRVRLEIEGIAAIKMEMRHDIAPVEVGKNVIYRMTLTNTGSAQARKIDVKATLPDLLKAIRADGPTKEVIAGKFVTFGTVDTLPPGAKVQFIFECQALKEGRARFRVEYTSELNPAPIFEEEDTPLVAPFSSPIPVPPGGGVPMPLPPGKN